MKPINPLSQHQSHILASTRSTTLSKKYPPILFTLVLASFYGARTNDKAATVAVINSYFEELQAFEPKFFADAREEAHQQFFVTVVHKTLAAVEMD